MELSWLQGLLLVLAGEGVLFCRWRTGTEINDSLTPQPRQRDTARGRYPVCYIHRSIRLSCEFIN